jgi:hypothetical protein
MSWSIWLFGFVWFWNLEYVDLFGFGIWNTYVVIWICNFFCFEFGYLDLVIWLFVCAFVFWICNFVFRFVNFVPKGKRPKKY